MYFVWIYIHIKLILFFNDPLKTIRQCFILTSKKSFYSFLFTIYLYKRTKDLWWQIKHGRLFINYLIHNTDYLDEINLIEIKYKKICYNTLTHIHPWRPWSWRPDPWPHRRVLDTGACLTPPPYRGSAGPRTPPVIIIISTVKI